MRILFDQGTPVPPRKHIDAHQVETAFERGRSSLQNGELLSLAEENRFDVLVTTDQNLKYQQNLKRRRISIVVITTTSWPRIQRSLPKIIHAIESVTMGSYVEVTVGSGS